MTTRDSVPAFRVLLVRDQTDHNLKTGKYPIRYLLVVSTWKQASRTREKKWRSNIEDCEQGRLS